VGEILLVKFFLTRPLGINKFPDSRCFLTDFRRPTWLALYLIFITVTATFAPLFIYCSYRSYGCSMRYIMAPCP
jgi:hypothetical protein